MKLEDINFWNIERAVILRLEMTIAKKWNYGGSIPFPSQIPIIIASLVKASCWGFEVEICKPSRRLSKSEFFSAAKMSVERICANKIAQKTK